MKKCALSVLLLTFITVIYSCGGGSSSNGEVTLSSIAVTPANSSIAVGNTMQFTATGTYSDGTTADLTTSATWSSGTLSVATIGSSSGLATSLAAGNTTISATESAVIGTTTLTVTASGGSFVLKWGSLGSGDGEFDAPIGIAVDTSGNVYVSDSGNDRIQKFDSDGNYLLQWGTEGMGDGQFINPGNIAIDSGNNIYVVDRTNNRVQEFDSDGTYLLKFIPNITTPITDVGQAAAIGVNPTSTLIYLITYNYFHIQEFDLTPTYVTQWGTYGTGNGEFGGLAGGYCPAGIAFAPLTGNVYVSDTYNYRLQELAADGTFVNKWGSEGSGSGEFESPQGIAVNASGEIYVVDQGNGRIQKFDSTGTFISQFGSSGTADGEFAGATNVAVDTSGNIYVVDTENNRIQKISM